MSYKAMNNATNKQQKEEIILGSLTERAQRIIHTQEYLQKLKEIKNKTSKIRYMDFVMDGVVIGMPYNG